MAIRFDSPNNDYLTRTTGLINYNAAYTWMGWWRIRVDVNNYGHFLAISSGTMYEPYDQCGVNSNGTDLRVEVTPNGSTYYNTDSDGAINATVDTWMHLALVRVSNTELRLYRDGTLIRTVTGSVAARVAVGRMVVGTLYDSGVNATVAHLKEWDAALSQAEIAAEMNVVAPVRTTNLRAYHPTALDATRLQDASGNGHHWTAAGTLTDEANPTLTSPVILGVPFNVSVGADYAPTIDPGAAAGTIEVPFSADAGADYAPVATLGAVPIAIPFDPSGGADYAPLVQVVEYQIEIMPAGSGAWELLEDWTADNTINASAAGYPAGTTGLRARARDKDDPVASISDWTEISVELAASIAVVVPFNPAAGADHAPTVEVAAQAVAVPFLAAAGVSYAPAIVEALSVSVPFASSGGLDFAPAVEVQAVDLTLSFAPAAGVDHAPVIESIGGAILVPFDTSDGADFAPSLAVPLAIAIPFSQSQFADYAPAIAVTEISIAVPFADNIGIDYVPATEITSVSILVPFAPSTGSNYVPIFGYPEAVPLQFIELEVKLARRLEIDTILARKLELEVKI